MKQIAALPGVGKRPKKKSWSGRKGVGDYDVLKDRQNRARADFQSWGTSAFRNSVKADSTLLFLDPFF
jgi:hypothetical protein